MAQDAVEVEPRNFATFDDPATPWDDRVVAQQSHFAFGDQGVYNIGVRPIDEDIGRGGDDPFGWPLSLAALTLKNIGGPAFEPCDGRARLVRDGELRSRRTSRRGRSRRRGRRLLPGHDAHAPVHQPGIRAGSDRRRSCRTTWRPGSTASQPASCTRRSTRWRAWCPTPHAAQRRPGIEFPEVLFGADLHCAAYNPAIFGMGPPELRMGTSRSDEGPSLCPQHQSGRRRQLRVPVPRHVARPQPRDRDGAFKAPPLRNVELTGPYFHTGSYLTLRQVVDFYFRGGDFPTTNAENRDPHVVDLDEHAFAFGPSQGGNLLTAFDCSADGPNDPAYPARAAAGCGSFSHLIGSFGDGLPDTAFLYDAYPDSDHPITPEPAFASRRRRWRTRRTRS